MESSVWLLLTALSHTLHSPARAGTVPPLTNAFQLLSPTFQLKRRTEQGLRGLPSTSSLRLLERSEPPGRGCRNQLYVPLAGLATDQKWLDGQNSLQRELTADFSDLKLYGSAHTHPELGTLSQEHHNLPLSSAASGSTWSHSVFSLLTWRKPSEYRRKGESPQSLLKNKNTERSPGSSAFNLTFQKCAEVNGKTLTVKLMINNLDVQSAFNVSRLTIQDSINVLSILGNVGNETEMGFQTYTKESLQAGERYIVNYTAVLKAGEPEEERNISLPAYLTIGSGTQGSQIQIGPLKADFILMMKAVTQVSVNHGFHVAGFIIAFIVSFAMVCLILITVFHVRRITDRNPSLQQVKRRPSNASSSVTDDGAECLKKNIQLQDRVVDIFLLEDPQKMTHALDNLYVSNTIQLDTVLEYHRKRMNLNAIVLLLRNFKHNKDLSPFLEERFNMVFRAQFEQVENSLNMEHREMLAVLAAQSNQGTRRKMEALYRKQEQEDKEAELLMQNVEDEVASQWRKNLEQLHMLEQQQLKSLMSVTHEEASANAQREMVIRLRQAFQKGVYDQLREVTRLEELDATSGRQLLQESWHIQFRLEMLMDQQQAFQRKLLEESLAIRRNLVKRIQSGVDHRRYLLNTAALHIADLIRQVKNAGYLTEGQVESLLEMVHQEIVVVKLRLDDVMDQEKKRMQQKLVSERRKLIVRRIGEHELQEKELASLLNTSGERTSCHKYLMDWHELLKKQAAELRELVEKLDEDALDQLEMLREQLTKDVSLRIKKIHTELAQKLLNFGVPKDYLKQMAESQEKETNLLHEKQMKQDEDEKHKASESLEKVKDELSNQLQSEIEEQKFLRLQKHLLLQNMVKTVLVLSEEEFQQMMQSFLDVFCQMDRSLALPKLRERSILQAHVTDRRKAKMEKLELRWRKQDKVKAKEHGHGDQVKGVALQEHIRHKIKLYDGEAERAAEEINKVCAELFHQRANQMKDLEENLGVCMASIQLCRAERQVRALEIHTAILNLQALLLEEMATAGLQCEPACNQVVQEHVSDLEQIIHLHSDKLQHELTVGTEQTEWNNWVEMQRRPLTEEDTAQCSSQMLVCLYQAMSKCKDTMEAESQRLRDEDRNSQLLEDVKGQRVVKTLLSLQDQELKLVAYLIQQLSIPVGICQALLNLLLPSAIQEELTLFVSRIYAERNACSGINKNKMDKQRKRKLWESLELKLRNKLIAENLGNMNVPCSRKGSILKKKRLQLLKQVSFSQSRGSCDFPPDDYPEPVNEGAGQMLEMADTGEKVFVFRIKKEEPCSSDLPPKKKKRNFLNFKRSTVANLDEF